MAGGLPAPVLSDFYDGLPVSAPTTEHQQTAATPFYKNNGYTHFELYIKTHRLLKRHCGIRGSIHFF